VDAAVLYAREIWVGDTDTRGRGGVGHVLLQGLSPRSLTLIIPFPCGLSPWC